MNNFKVIKFKPGRGPSKNRGHGNRRQKHGDDDDNSGDNCDGGNCACKYLH